MSVATTMAALANAVKNGTSIDRAFDYPSDGVSPPCVVAGYPEIDFDVAYQAIKQRSTYPVWILVGKPTERVARDAITPYLDSVPPTIDGNLGGAVDSASCKSAKVAETEVAGITYLGILFSVEVIEA